MSRNNAGSSISKPIRKAVPAFEADEKHDYEGNSSSAETPIAVPQQQHQPSFDPSLMRSTAVVANASTTPVGSTGGGGASSEEDSVAEMMDYLSEGERSSNLSSSEQHLQKRARTLHSSLADMAAPSPMPRSSKSNRSTPTSAATTLSGATILHSPGQAAPASNSKSASSSPHHRFPVGDAASPLIAAAVSAPKQAHFSSDLPTVRSNVGDYSSNSAFNPLRKSDVPQSMGETPTSESSGRSLSRDHSTDHFDGNGGIGSTADGATVAPGGTPEVAEAVTDHKPTCLPKFRDPQTCMWTGSHAANCPSEDRSSSLVNVLLQPLPPNFDSLTQLPPLEQMKDYQTLIRLNLWSVIDGHGGGCVATYASEVLLPHIAASVSRALGCAIVDRGTCVVNGQLRDANALDLDGLIQVNNEPGSGGLFSNPNSIHYRSPYERSDSEEEDKQNEHENHDNKTTAPSVFTTTKPKFSKKSSSIDPKTEKGKSSKESKVSSSVSVGTSSEEEISLEDKPPKVDASGNSDSGTRDVDNSTAVVSTSTRGPPAVAVKNSALSPAPSKLSKENVEKVEAQTAQAAVTAGANSMGTGGLVGTEGEVCDASVSSVKTSVKTAASLANKPLVGTHSPREVAAITRAITESFLAVDEGWINSIDPVATHQTSCQSNGRWNSGACALVVFTIQRLDWCSVSEPDREKESRGPEKSRRNTSQNRDAARRRMLDYAARTKSASSMSTVSSTSSLTTEEAAHASGLESEITETEGEDDAYGAGHFGSYEGGAIARRRFPSSNRNQPFASLISPPGGCSCHCYRAHDAIMYTAHVGDCRAVMLGSAPPRTIKVRGGANKSSGDNDITTDDDESSHHSSDETECLSSSDHDADSSEEEDYNAEDPSTTPTPGDLVSASQVTASSGTVGTSETSASLSSASSYRTIPRRVVRTRRKASIDDYSGPFRPLPPLVCNSGNSNSTPSSEPAVDILDGDGSNRPRGGNPSGNARGDDNSTSSGSSRNDESSSDGTNPLPLVHLPPVTRPIDLTTDHSAYNPAEVTAVLRRCNNAPRAISAGMGGGIKRVAGSLAVTRALGDAYLKTPLLSFNPYKSHAPYITARPEVNCRPLVKGLDKVLILATDGVWERASGEDVLRWVRNFYEERVAEAERRSNRRQNAQSLDPSSNKDSKPTVVEEATNANSNSNNNNSTHEGADRDLFETTTVTTRNGQDVTNGQNLNSRKRDHAGSPTGPNKRRKRNSRMSYNVADVIVRRVLNKVRRARNISSLQALMSLPLGRARRSKHDDITSSVVDLSAFVS